MKLRPGLSQLFVALLLLSAIVSCQKELKFDKGPHNDHNLVLHFKPVVRFDSVPLELGKSYTNFFNEQFTPTAFKFYIHSITMINTDSGKNYVVPLNNGAGIFLVDFSDSISTEIKVPILPYTYDNIAFIIGVDSAYNVATNNTGSLDPEKGMYWDATRGYVMAKLEGTSGGKNFEYSIGGFSGPDNVMRKVTLLFPYAQDINLLPGKSTTLEITADAYDWFNQPHDVRIATNPVINTPGLLATQVAENYRKMFTVDSVINH